jgi:hypothetical protein
MKKTIFILALVLGTFVVKAQVPGYQGLRFSVKYDCGIMHPAIIGRRGTPPYIFHNISLEYVLTRSISLGVMYTYMGYNGPPNKLALPAYAITEGSVNPNDYKGTYRQHCITVIAKKFFRRKGYIAPVGRYVSFGLFYQYALDRSVAFGNSGNSLYTPQGFKGTANIPGIHFGVGRNFIVADRLIIDFGGMLNLDCYATLPTSAFENRITFRDVFFTNLMQLYLGLGVLAF